MGPLGLVKKLTQQVAAPLGAVALGIDIGQRSDPTALCVTDYEQQEPGRHVIRYLERLPLGTPYPQVAARLATQIALLRERYSVENPPVWLDATGVGKPVVDLLAEAGIAVTPVFFTHGDQMTERGDGSISLGKAYLVSALKVGLQMRRVLLPNSAEARALDTELENYEIHVDDKANDTYGAFKVGAHDDLVTALGLAMLAAQHGRSGHVGVWFI